MRHSLDFELYSVAILPRLCRNRVNKYSLIHFIIYGLVMNSMDIILIAEARNSGCSICLQITPILSLPPQATDLMTSHVESHTGSLPSHKAHETLTRWWFDVGPASPTLAQHQITTGRCDHRGTAGDTGDLGNPAEIDPISLETSPLRQSAEPVWWSVTSGRPEKHRERGWENLPHFFASVYTTRKLSTREGCGGGGRWRNAP